MTISIQSAQTYGGHTENYWLATYGTSGERVNIGLKGFIDEAHEPNSPDFTMNFWTPLTNFPDGVNNTIVGQYLIASGNVLAGGTIL